MNIGWLGGSFDPVHNAHLKLAQAALAQLKLDKVYLVLSPLSPFKKNKTRTPVADRLAMLKLALKSKNGLVLGSFELNRRGKVYTVSSLQAYKKKYPRHQLFLIMGSDTWAGFSGWKNPQKILNLATPVVGRRPGAAVNVSKNFAGPIILKGKFPDISSTAFRKTSKRNGLNKAVVRYINQHHLYEN